MRKVILICLLSYLIGVNTKTCGELPYASYIDTNLIKIINDNDIDQWWNSFKSSSPTPYSASKIPSQCQSVFPAGTTNTCCTASTEEDIENIIWAYVQKFTTSTILEKIDQTIIQEYEECFQAAYPDEFTSSDLLDDDDQDNDGVVDTEDNDDDNDGTDDIEDADDDNDGTKDTDDKDDDNDGVDDSQEDDEDDDLDNDGIDDSQDVDADNDGTTDSADADDDGDGVDDAQDNDDDGDGAPDSLDEEEDTGDSASDESASDESASDESASDESAVDENEADEDDSEEDPGDEFEYDSEQEYDPAFEAAMLEYERLDSQLFWQLINSVIAVVNMQRGSLCALCVDPDSAESIAQIFDGTSLLFDQDGVDAYIAELSDALQAIQDLYPDIKEYLYFRDDWISGDLQCPKIKGIIDKNIADTTCGTPVCKGVVTSEFNGYSSALFQYAFTPAPLRRAMFEKNLRSQRVLVSAKPVAGGALKANVADPSKDGKLKFKGQTADQVKSKVDTTTKAAETQPVNYQEALKAAPQKSDSSNLIFGIINFIAIISLLLL